MRKVLGYWWWLLSTVCTAAALWVALTGKGPGPRWAWFVVAYAVIVIASGIAIWKAERRALLFDALKKKQSEIVDEWTALDSLYQRSHKEAIFSPMEPKQWGDENCVFRIGVLQGKTLALLGDFQRVGIEIGYVQTDIRSVPELVRVLERSRPLL